LILRKRMRKFMNFSRFVFLDKRDLLKQKASARRAVYVAGAALLLLLLFPFRNTVTGPVVLEPAQMLPVRAETAGFITEVADQDGLVPAGAVIARLRNSELVAQRQQAQAEVDRLSAESTGALAAGNMAAYQASSRQRQRAQLHLTELLRQESSLAIRAPFSGYILTLRLEDLVGKRVEPGELICDFGALDRVRARISVSEFDFRELAEGQPVRLKANSFAGETFTGKVAQRALASPETYNASGRMTALERRVYAAPGKQEGTPFAHFEVLLEIPNPNGKLRPGMSGLAQIAVQRHSVLARVYIFFRDLFRSKVWW
jgi:multidrug resistance efflux pump